MMWPILLDMTKEESMQHLRCLEIDAFSGLVSALRAQGSLDHEKLKILKDTGSILHISQERHKAEIRRVVNDERLNTIAYHVNGEKHSADEWAEEGQRLIPLIARVAPQTAYSAIADEVADSANKLNKQLPSPSLTERKRPSSISPTHPNASTSDLCSKSLQFRLSEPDMKKRKMSLENSNLAQHLMGPPKISKIQQIYRQKTKARQKEQLMKLKSQELDKSEYIHIQQVTVPKPHQQIISQSSKVQSKVPVNQIATAVHNSPKINILQNISIQAPVQSMCDEQQVDGNSNTDDTKDGPPSQPGCSNDNQANKLMNKVLSNATLNKVNQLTIKTAAGTSDAQKTIKVCAPRKTVTSKTVTTSSGQKLIVVSNPQTLTSSSILQRTLTTIPFKNISVKNFDKFKIVTSTSSSSPQSAAPIQIQNSKQKVVTVRTAANKKMIPFSQVQVLNTKGGIKVLPLGGKIISKSNASASPMYFMSTTSGGEGSGTKSTTSTPVLMSCKPQDNSPTADTETNNTSQESTNFPMDGVEEDKADLIEAIVKSQVNSSETVYALSEHIQKADEITVTTKDDVRDDETEETVVKNEGEVCEDNLDKICNDTNSFYVIDGEHADEDIVIDSLQIPQPLEVLNIVGSLDPITGQYSVDENEQETTSVVESHVVEAETADVDDATN